MTDYFADDGNFLPNKLGLSEGETLKKTEQDIVSRKSARLIEEEPPQDFNFEYLKHIHEVLFEELYDFAGQVRTVDITKPDNAVPFAHSEYIIPEATRIFDDLADKNYLVDLDMEAFINEIVYFASDLNALHPFREGNGRTIRMFLIFLAEHAGYLIDYSLVSADEIIAADKHAFEGDPMPLLDLYTRVVIPDVFDLPMAA